MEGSGETIITHSIKDGFGTLLQTETAVWTRKCGENPQHFYRALAIDHPHFLPGLVYNETHRVMVHQTYHCDLKTYMENQQKKHVDVVDVYPIRCIGGENEGKHINYKYITPVYRRILKSMIKFITDQHLKDFSLTDFSAKNIVFVEDVLKFAGVGLICGADAKARKNDFSHLLHVTEEIFGAKLYSGNRTEELKDLVSWMRKPTHCNRNDCGLFMLHHIAIMSPKEVVLFFISCKEKLSQLNDVMSGRFNIAIKNMRNCDDWWSRFSSYEQFYTDKCFFASKEKYVFHKRENEKNKDAADYKVKTSLLTCCRNIAVHLQENVPGSVKLLELDLERMVLPIFAKDLCSLYHQLYVLKCLEPFVLNY